MNPTITTTVTPSLLQTLEAEANQTADPNETPRFRTFTADSVYDAAPPLEFLIGEGDKGLITKGSVNLMVGEPGSKKTFAALDMAVCVAIGKNWLDFATRQAPVLIVDEESGERRLKRRLFETLNGHLVGRDAAPQITCMSLQQFDARNPDHVNALQVMILQTGAGLVIIDAFADIIPGADENSVKDVMPAMIALRGLAETTQAALLVIHHSNKQTKEYRGSTAIKGALDLMLMVDSPKGSKLISFSTSKERDIEAQAFTASAHFAPNQFYLMASDLNPKQHTNPAQRHVLRYLLENPGASIEDLTDDIYTPANIRAVVKNFYDSGHVENKNKGKTGRGHKAELYLTAKGEELAKVEAE